MRATGVHISNRSLRVAEMTGSRRNPALGRVFVAPLEAEDGDGAALGRVLREQGFAAGHVCLSLAGDTAVVRRLRLPVSNPRTAERAVRFQAEEVLCGESLENVIVDHEVLGPEPGGGTEVLVLIVRKADVGRGLALLADAGVENGSVTLDGVALFNLAAALRELPERGRAALVDLDGPRIRILVARDRKLETFRVARPAPSSGTDDPGEDAARELERTLAGAGITDPLDRILVTGDGAAEQARLLARRFQVEARPLGIRAADAPEGDFAAGAAAGAALKALGAEALPADFRKEEFAPRAATARVWFMAVYALVALATLFGILLAGSVRRQGQARAQLARLVSEETKYWKKVFPEKPFPRVGFDRYILSAKTGTGAKQESSRPQYASFLDALSVAAESSPGEGIQVQAFQFDQQRLVIAGEVEGMDVFERLVNNLKARFGVRVKPTMERRGKPGKEKRTFFKVEVPRAKEVR